jgi:hypothetical protein
LLSVLCALLLQCSSSGNKSSLAHRRKAKGWRKRTREPIAEDRMPFMKYMRSLIAAETLDAVVRQLTVRAASMCFCGWHKIAGAASVDIGAVLC